MSGCHICLFTTGRGNPIGNACMTTIKITGNPQTATALEDMIDYSAAPMLYGELSLQESGRELYELLLRVANGEEKRRKSWEIIAGQRPTEPVTTATIDFCCAGPGWDRNRRPEVYSGRLR